MTGNSKTLKVSQEIITCLNFSMSFVQLEKFFFWLYKIFWKGKDRKFKIKESL